MFCQLEPLTFILYNLQLFKSMRYLLIVGIFFASLGFSQNNCPASLVCASFTNNPNGAGVQELTGANQGCLATEHNSCWLTITAGTTGTLNFSITPAGNRDFDYAVWGPNSPCPPTAAPIRCSFAANQGAVGGVGNGALDQTEGVGGDGWTQTINVIANETYLILVDRFIGGSGNGSFTITFGGTTTIICSSLPIELLSFTGTAHTDYNILNWTTATETNNDFFSIERSIDGIQWNVLGTVPGAGNSTSLKNYSYADERPLYGVNYYRLKQTDYNGAYEYSQIIALTSIADNKISAYPNPLTTELNVVIVSDVQKEAEIHIVDILGREVVAKVVNIDPGRNQVVIDMSSVPNGTYFVTVSVEAIPFNIQVIKDI